MLTLLPSSADDSPSGDGWGKFFVGLLGGVALAIGVLVLVNLKNGQPVVPSYVTREELQHTINTMGRSVVSSSSQRSRSMRSAGSAVYARKEAVSSIHSPLPRAAGRVSASSAVPQQMPESPPERTHMWVRTVRWTWPVPVVPAEGQAVVGRILFRNSCAGPMAISRIHMAYSGPNPFLIRGVTVIDTSSGEPLMALTPLVLNTNRRSGEVELLLDLPVELEPCEQDSTVPFEERTDLFSMDIVVEAGMDQNDWSVHTLYFVPEWVTADGRVVWDDKVNPTEGVFQFFTGKNSRESSP